MELKSGVLWLGIHLKIQETERNRCEESPILGKNKQQQKKFLMTFGTIVFHSCIRLPLFYLLPFFRVNSESRGPCWGQFGSIFSPVKRQHVEIKQPQTINPADAINKMCLTQLDPNHKETHTRPHLQLQAPSRWTLNNFRLPFLWVAQSIYCPAPLSPPRVYMRPPRGADLALLKRDAVLSTELEENSSAWLYKPPVCLFWG